MSQIEKARIKAEQATARYQALVAKQKTNERKKDTRRKIILGGLLLDEARKDERYKNVLEDLIRKIQRKQDLKAFENWNG